MKTLIDLVKGSPHVHRWAGQTVNGHRRSISEHHSEVYVWVKEILDKCPITRDYFLASSPIVTMELFNHAMFHDIPEVFTGDIPYTTKLQFPEIKETLSQVEEKIEKQYNLTMDQLQSIEKNIVMFVVKVADMFVVYDEFVDYKDCKGVSVMDTMSKNVFKKYRNPSLQIPRAILDEIEDFYHVRSNEDMISKLEKLHEYQGL